MEKLITEYFNNMSLEQTEKLLENTEIGISLDSHSINRIDTLFCKKAGFAITDKRLFPKLKVCIVIAAAMVFVLGMAFHSPIMAYLKLIYGEGLTEDYGLAQSAILLDMAPVNINDHTVQVNAVVGDNAYLYLLFDLTIPAYLETAGEVSPTATIRFIDSMGLNINGGISYGFYELRREETGYNTVITMMLELECASMLPHANALNLSFSQFLISEEDTADIILAKGPWNFEIPLDYTDVSLKYDLEEPVDIGEAYIQQIAISPLTVKITGMEKQIISYEDTIDNSRQRAANPPLRDITLFDRSGQAIGALKQGTRSQTLVNSGNPAETAQLMEISSTYIFIQPINPETVYSISINGNEVLLKN